MTIMKNKLGLSHAKLRSSCYLKLAIKPTSHEAEEVMEIESSILLMKEINLMKLRRTRPNYQKGRGKGRNCLP